MPLPLTFSCFSKIQIGFTILVLADLGTPGKRAVNHVMNVGLFAAINAYTGRWLNRTTLKDVLLMQWGTSDYLSGSYRRECVSGQTMEKCFWQLQCGFMLPLQ